MKTKVRFKKPHPALIAAIAVLLVLSTVTILSLNAAVAATRAETDALRGEAHEQELLRDKLARSMEELGTIEGILQVALEIFGLVPPGTVIFEAEPTN